MKCVECKTEDACISIVMKLHDARMPTIIKHYCVPCFDRIPEKGRNRREVK